MAEVLEEDPEDDVPMCNLNKKPKKEEKEEKKEDPEATDSDDDLKEEKQELLSSDEDEEPDDADESDKKKEDARIMPIILGTKNGKMRIQMSNWEGTKTEGDVEELSSVRITPDEFEKLEFVDGKLYEATIDQLVEDGGEELVVVYFGYGLKDSKSQLQKPDNWDEIKERIGKDIDDGGKAVQLEWLRSPEAIKRYKKACSQGTRAAAIIVHE